MQSLDLQPISKKNKKSDTLKGEIDEEGDVVIDVSGAKKKKSRKRKVSGISLSLESEDLSGLNDKKNPLF